MRLVTKDAYDTSARAAMITETTKAYPNRCFRGGIWSLHHGYDAGGKVEKSAEMGVASFMKRL